MEYPDDRQYTQDHEWVAVEGDTARVGLTAYAADALGEAVFVDPPQPGTSLTAATPCGEIESTKSVSDLVAPADGEVLEVNDAVVEDPALATGDPYGRGWLYTMRLTGAPQLLTAGQYADLVEGDEQ